MTQFTKKDLNLNITFKHLYNLLILQKKICSIFLSFLPFFFFSILSKYPSTKQKSYKLEKKNKNKIKIKETNDIFTL